MRLSTLPEVVAPVAVAHMQRSGQLTKSSLLYHAVA